MAIKMEKTEQVKISIIVPVYNMEKYLASCIDSLISVPMQNIEIILLNDGSKDRSLEICQNYAEKDCRIRVYSHPNRGLGPTRNRGITLAAGKYLAFVDSDDFVDISALEEMLQKAEEKQLDVVQAETMTFVDGKEEKNLRKSLAHVKDYSITDEESKEVFFEQYYFKRIYSHNACDKLYRAEFVNKNRLEFGDNKRIFAEDNWFQLQVLFHNPKIGFLNVPYYFYRQQNNSITHTYQKDFVKRHEQMIIDYEKLIGENKCEKKVSELLSFDGLIMDTMNFFRSSGEKDFRTYMSESSAIINSQVLSANIKNITSDKAYQYYNGNHAKRIFILIISCLYRFGNYTLAHRLIYVIYHNRYVKEKDSE